MNGLEHGAGAKVPASALDRRAPCGYGHHDAAVSHPSKSAPPRLLVPRALRVAVVTAVTVVAGAVLVAGALDACDPSSTGGNADAGDAGDGCYRILGVDGGELYRDCPVEGSECARRIFPDGAVRDGPC